MTEDRPHGGLWFEELTPGLVIRHRLRRTVTETDNIMFTTMTMNPAALHLDFDYAEKETQFGQPLVNSMFTAVGCRNFCSRNNPRHHGR